jgi:hypothetical protein
MPLLTLTYTDMTEEGCLKLQELEEVVPFIRT